MFPSQNYRSDITSIYDKLKRETEEIPIEKLTYSFRKKYDEQHRYYIVLIPEGENRKNYNYIRNIALPRVTKYCFIKLEDEKTKKKYIYMRPIFFNDLKMEEEIDEIIINSNDSELVKKNKKAKREKQGQYRAALLDVMPFCPFTMIADDRLLVACHIKPFRECKTDEEKYDPKNGITMTPTYHVLFDLGFISFEDDGTLLVSPFLSNVTKKKLHLNEGNRIRLQTGSNKYLDYHRKNIFCKMPNIVLSDDDL